MIELAEAQKIANEAMARDREAMGDRWPPRVVAVPELTLEREWGWLFVMKPPEYDATMNGPVFVGGSLIAVVRETGVPFVIDICGRDQEKVLEEFGQKISLGLMEPDDSEFGIGMRVRLPRKERLPLPIYGYMTGWGALGAFVSSLIGAIVAKRTGAYAIIGLPAHSFDVAVVMVGGWIAAVVYWAYLCFKIRYEISGWHVISAGCVGALLVWWPSEVLLHMVVR